MRKRMKKGNVHSRKWFQGFRKQKGRLAIRALTTCLTVMFCFGSVPVAAVFNESKAITFGNYSASHSIEDSTLFIGTWLIHMQSLTDELYEKALESASESNQTNIYYKSELAGGIWVDITDASGLGEISGEGKIVEDSELAGLWVTSYTGSDGITRNARTGVSVNIFDTPDPYDLYNLPEMEPIRIQFDNSFSKDKTGVDKYYYDILKRFFEYELGEEERPSRPFNRLRSSTTDTYDRQLAALQRCYEQLQAADEAESAEIVHKLMAKLDAARRAEVFGKLGQIEGNELEGLQGRASGTGYVAENYDGKDFIQNTNVMDAIGTALENAQTAYITHSGKMLAESSTVIGKEEYSLSNQIVAQAEGGFSPRLEALLRQLNALYNIREGVVANVEEELVMAESMTAQAKEAYTALIWQGAGIQYQSTLAKGASLSAQNQVLEEQKTTADEARTQLQFLVEAMTKRMGAEEAVEYIYDRIDEASTWSDPIKTDAFRGKAAGSLDAYLLWLQELAKKILSGNEAFASRLDKLEKEKEDLLSEQEAALDNNDLALANKYDALMEALDQEIDHASQELKDRINDPLSSAADKARAENEAGSSTALNNINQLKNSALTMMASGSSQIGSFLDALSALGAEDALKEIGDRAGEELKDEIEDAIAASKDSTMHDLYGDGSLSAAAWALMGRIEDFFGAEFENLSGSSQATVVYALEEMRQKDVEGAGELAAIYAKQCAEAKNTYVYRGVNSTTRVWVPVKVVGICTGYRYLYDDSRNQAILGRGDKTYLMTVGSSTMEVRVSEGKKGGNYQQSRTELEEKIRLQEIPYVDAADALEQFGCYALLVQRTEYGVGLSGKMHKQAQEFIAQVSEAEE